MPYEVIDWGTVGGGVLCDTFPSNLLRVGRIVRQIYKNFATSATCITSVFV